MIFQSVRKKLIVLRWSILTDWLILYYARDITCKRWITIHYYLNSMYTHIHINKCLILGNAENIYKKKKFHSLSMFFYILFKCSQEPHLDFVGVFALTSRNSVCPWILKLLVIKFRQIVVWNSTALTNSFSTKNGFLFFITLTQVYFYYVHVSERIDKKIFLCVSDE